MPIDQGKKRAATPSPPPSWALSSALGMREVKNPDLNSTASSLIWAFGSVPSKAIGLYNR
jgi:hypothetical protein